MKREESLNIQRLRKLIKEYNEELRAKGEKEISAFFLSSFWQDSHLANPIAPMQYLTNVSLQGVLFVTMDSSWLITDGRYADRARNFAGVEHVSVINKGSYLRDLKRKKAIKPGELVVYDCSLLSVEQEIHFMHVFKENREDFLPIHRIVEYLSSMKTPEEIEKTKKAIVIAENIFEDKILPRIKPGVDTLELRAEMAYQGEMAKAERSLAIILIGEHSLFGHGETGSSSWRSKIEKGDIIVFNWGVSWQGYFSDITRTIIVGNPTSKQHKVFMGAYKAALQIQEEWIRQIEPGVKVKDLLKMGNEIVDSKDKKEYKFNITGHGIGMKLHNWPLFTGGNTQEMEVSQILALEPGINVEKIGCARVGDEVLVTEEGCELLTSLSREIIIV